jgi:DNA-binding response OmpR family regulator
MRVSSVAFSAKQLMSNPFVVLMVEDDHATLSLLGAIARREGFDALLVDDGDKALSILQHHPVDAMVLDLLLPRTNGFDILRHCKCALPRLMECTIVITAASEQVYRECQEVREVRRFFRKPLDFVDLTSALHACRAARAKDDDGLGATPPSLPRLREIRLAKHKTG